MKQKEKEEINRINLLTADIYQTHTKLFEININIHTRNAHIAVAVCRYLKIVI